MRFSTVCASLASLSASTLAFTITSPTGSAYWVQFSTNTIAWTTASGDSPTVTLQIINPNSTHLNGAFSIAEFVPASRQSFEVTNVTLTVADGYIVQFVNPLNNSQIYVRSDPFSVQPSGTTPAPVAGAKSNSTSTAGTSGTNSSLVGGARNTTASATGFSNNGTAKGNATSGAGSAQIPLMAGLLAFVGSAIRVAMF